MASTIAVSNNTVESSAHVSELLDKCISCKAPFDGVNSKHSNCCFCGNSLCEVCKYDECENPVHNDDETPNNAWCRGCDPDITRCPTCNEPFCGYCTSLNELTECHICNDLSCRRCMYEPDCCSNRICRHCFKDHNCENADVDEDVVIPLETVTQLNSSGSSSSDDEEIHSPRMLDVHPI